MQGSGQCGFKVIFQHRPRGTEWNHENLNKDYLPYTDICSRELQDMDHERCSRATDRCSSNFSFVVLNSEMCCMNFWLIYCPFFDTFNSVSRIYNHRYYLKLPSVKCLFSECQYPQVLVILAKTIRRKQLWSHPKDNPTPKSPEWD